MLSVPDSFGCMVFNEARMKARLPKEPYKAMKKTIRDGRVHRENKDKHELCIRPKSVHQILQYPQQAVRGIQSISLSRCNIYFCFHPIL